MNQFDGNVGGTVTLAAGAGLSCPLSPPTRAVCCLLKNGCRLPIQIMGPLVLLLRKTSNCCEPHYSFNDFMSLALLWPSAEGFRAPEWLMDPVKMTSSGWSDPDCSKLWILGELNCETIRGQSKILLQICFHSRNCWIFAWQCSGGLGQRGPWGGCHFPCWWWDRWDSVQRKC